MEYLNTTDIGMIWDGGFNALISPGATKQFALVLVLLLV